MDKKFRRSTLEKIAANAGILTSMVQNALGTPAPNFKSLGSVGPGTTVMMPSNPVKPDGSVDIVINIRGIAGGDTKTVSGLGVNAVVVTAEAGGKGSKENAAQFGNAQFVNEAVSKVIGFLQKQYPDKQLKRGKLVVSGFSGGGGAIAKMLTERSRIKGGLDGVLINDGLHTDPGSPAMQAVLDYAKDAQNDPSKKFKLIHTAVVPGKYVSTTDTANYLLNQLKLQRQPVQQWSGKGAKPASAAVSGGLEVYQLYDKELPYMAKDPRTGETRPNVIDEDNLSPLTSGGQHILANRFLGDYLKNML